jgi:hypothetical protein
LVHAKLVFPVGAGMLDQLAAMLVGGWRFSNGGRVFDFEGFEPPPS